MKYRIVLEKPAEKFIVKLPQPEKKRAASCATMVQISADETEPLNESDTTAIFFMVTPTFFSAKAVLVLI